MKNRSALHALYTTALATSHCLLLHAQNIIVTTIEDENDGDLSGEVSLREALIHASADRSIIFDPSLNGKTIVLSAGEQLLIDRSLTIDASALNDGIILDANGTETNHRILQIESGLSVSLTGLTFIGGESSGINFPETAGGAIYNDGSTLTLNACTFRGNTASFFGGAVYSDGSSTQDASLTLNNCTLSENTANFGGAIYSDGFDQGNSTLILNASTLDGNTASSEGGAIYCDGFDGGLSSLSLNSCTLTNNSSASFGGAIYNDGSSNGSSSISITNSTITANSASAEGGAIYSDGFDEGTSTLLLTHSILANNSAPLGPDLRETDEETGAITTAVGQNLISSTADTNISSDSPELTLIDGADLGLAPLGDYGGLTRTMIPLAGSPAIDAAPSSTRTHDQRGSAISDGSPDIGAVESQGDDMLTLFWNIDTDGDGTPFGVEFALGTDPLVPDPGHPNNLKISRPNDGDISLSFSANPDALGEAVWIIERSSDLRTWTTLFSSSTPSETTTVMDDSTQGTVYYRFRANQQ